MPDFDTTDPRTPDVLFPLGRTVATPGVMKLVRAGRINPAELFARHQSGDWGEIDPDDRGINEQALKDGSRILSVYKSDTAPTVWVITEANRSATTILFPEDY